MPAGVGVFSPSSGMIPAGGNPFGIGTSAASTPTSLDNNTLNQLLGTVGQTNTDTATATQDAALATKANATQQEDLLAQQGADLQQQGYGAEAGAYGQAASLAGTNSQLALASGLIQQLQTARQVFKTNSQVMAATGANGFTGLGSSLYIMAENAGQGALEEQLQGVQAEENALGYREQQAAATAEQTAVQTASAEAGVAAESEGVAASEAGTEAATYTNMGAQATQAAQASATNAQNAITALGGPTSNPILQGISNSLSASLASPGTLANPIINYSALPGGGLAGTASAAPAGSGGGFRVIDPFNTPYNPRTGQGGVDPLTGYTNPSADPTFGID